jgi:nucleoside-diphosphate-sugar epimerase
VNILLTGASSFSGFWFARELAAAGHHVVAPLRGAEGSYAGVRAARIRELAECAEIVWSTTFGDPRFLDLITAETFELLCHHAARVAEYRSPDFDVVAALAENTRELPRILRTACARGLRGLVLTGSVFEADEGAGDTPLRAFSPYGVSKGITAAVVGYWCSILEVPLGKFIISNPFGPFEEPRFCTYLINTWRAGKAAEVRTPSYVRDNIHVTLLAKAYARFAEATFAGPAFRRANPSGYVESQGAFAQRFAAEVGPRLGLDATVTLLQQTDFSEPLVRINTQPINGMNLGWVEAEAWDSIAAYYRQY